MKSEQTRKLLFIIYNALAIALVTVATMVIRIPTLNGYVNFGDIMIFVAAAFLGRKSGLIAGAFGSAIADLLAGYTIYAPGTFVIKGLEGLICGIIIWKLRNKNNNPLTILMATIPAGLWMVAGYFIYEFFLYGYAGAIPSVMSNLLQGLVSAIAAFPLIFALKKAKFGSDFNF